jgi:uncharacterized integral membrane protein
MQGRTARIVLIAFPIVLALLCAILLWIPETRSEVKWLLSGSHREQRPVELITFAAFMVGGFMGMVLSWRLIQRREPVYLAAFYAIFSLGLFVTGMEEVAWGQWLFRFETPETFKVINKQRELTLHNIRGLHGHSEYFRLVFGVGALLGLGAAFVKPLRRVAVPRLLWSWVLVIAVLAAIDFLMDIYRPDRYTYRTFGVYMSEVTEMLIGLLGVLYVWLKARMFRSEWHNP